MAVATRALLHMKPGCAGNFKSIYVKQFSFLYFIGEPQNYRFPAYE
jgi:hypothetical protein